MKTQMIQLDGLEDQMEDLEMNLTFPEPEDDEDGDDLIFEDGDDFDLDDLDNLDDFGDFDDDDF